MKKKTCITKQESSCEKARGGLKVRTRVKAGGLGMNRCEAPVRREKPKAAAVRVKTGVKAGCGSFTEATTQTQLS